MTQPSTAFRLSEKAQQGILQLHVQCFSMFNQQWNIREQMREIDLSYIREQDWLKEHRRAQVANRYGDTNRIQNVTVPIVLPQVEAAVTYQSSVFLTGVPLFGVVADPQFEDEALQLESVIDQQAIRGGWVRELMLHFRDGFKYNLAALEVSWCREVTAALETDIAFSAKQGKPKEILWEGNKLKRLDLYNTFYDTRVPATELYKRGEFAGYTELMSRIELKAFINALPDKMIENIKPAFESGIGSPIYSSGIESYYIPQINPNALINKDFRATTDWMAWAQVAATSQGMDIRYRNMYEVTTLYARILPLDFDIRVPASATPQVWKFIIVNHSVLIYAERLTNAHAYIPILMSQPLEDGLMYQTKSLASNVKPLQEVASALMNSILASRRRAISDRVIYDPSRISEEIINSDSPTAKMPCRPSAYGKNIAESVYAFPYRDDQTAVTMQEIQSIQQFSNLVSGHNQAQQGQFVKGNKTLHEYADVMNRANGRDQLVSILLEFQLFTPIKEILKINILQYQGGISIYNRDKNKQVDIDPVALRQAVLNFKVSDGLVPTEKLINSDTMQVALQVIGSSPQLAQAYNIAPLVSYLFKTQGADMKAFEKSKEQIAYEQALAAWQQQMQQLVEVLSKGTVDASKIQFPPQPQPQQFGYLQPQQPQTQQQVPQ